MTQKRILLNPKHYEKADEILTQTGITNLSQLFSIFIVNYGDSLINSLKSDKSEQAQKKQRSK